MSYQFLEIPRTCPVCGQPTEIRTESRSGVRTLWCNNPNCGQSKNQGFKHFVSRDAMNIVGLSEGVLGKLQDIGCLNTISDIFRLEDWEDELKSIDGFGERSVSKLLDAIEASKQVRLENFIYALGIPNVGLQTAKLIAKHCNYDLDDFRNTDYRSLIMIQGLGDTIATNVDEWLSDENNQAELDEMIGLGLEIIGTDRSVGTSLAGKIFCCTGAVYQFSSRTELKEYIESQGGKLTSAVSAKTNYLITNDTTSGSAKNKAAAALGIPILTEQEFIDQFGGK